MTSDYPFGIFKLSLLSVWNPQGKRSRGRPRNTWHKDTESELKEQGHNWKFGTRQKN